MTDQLEIIAKWRDGMDWMFLIKDNNNVSSSKLPQLFKEQLPDYIYNGFYAGVEPREYMLVYGLEKQKVNQHLAHVLETESKKIKEELKKRYEFYFKEIDRDFNEILKKRKEIEKVINSSRKLDSYCRQNA